MKNLFSFFVLLFVGLTSLVAQPLSDGYYRIQNFGSNRFAFLCDNTGSVDFTNIIIDAGAIELWRDREFVSDPASIYYVKYEGQKTYSAGGSSYTVSQYNLKSQGTSVKEILNNDGFSVAIKSDNASHYYIYGAASKAGTYMEKFLDDEVNKGPSDPNHARYPEYNRGYVGINKSGDNQKWNCHPISATGDSYFGVKPQLQANGKHYQPFYAAFPFKAYSSGVKFYAVTKVDKAAGIAVISELQGAVPAAYPVIVETSSADPSNNRLELLASDSNNAPANALAGVYFNNEERSNRKAYNSSTMRLLSVNAQGKLVFAKASVSYLPANQAYLQVDADAPAELIVMTEEEYNSSANVQVGSITLNETSQTLTEGETFQLTATVAPADATDPTLTWTSSNVAVATVSATGLVTAVSAGSATITAKANDGSGVSASCTITVQEPVVLVTSVTLSETSATLIVGDTFQLEATVSPEDATDTSLTWTSSKPSVATVDANGLVTAVAEGKVTITAKANDGSGKKATCTITVEKAVVLVGEIVLDQTVAELEVGKTLQLTASVLPADADDATVTWSSSDETLAIVSASGLVEALAVGEVVITATANDESGVSASCTITIKPDSGIEGVRVDSMGAADIYTLSGVKVRLAGETLEGLTPGLYIVGGNKVIIY